MVPTVWLYSITSFFDWPNPPVIIVDLSSEMAHEYLCNIILSFWFASTIYTLQYPQAKNSHFHLQPQNNNRPYHQTE